MPNLKSLLLGLLLCLAPLSLSAESVSVVNVVRELPQADKIKVLPKNQDHIILSFAPVVKQVAPAVVSIFARRLNKSAKADTNTSPFDQDPFFKRFLKKQNPKKEPQKSLGSGVIVSDDGIIITNYHVIAPGDEIRVVLHDRREYFAKVMLVDHQTDLAALKINVGKEKLPFLKLEDDEDLEVGDVVLAIGNPFGVGQSVTSGIISALSRSQKGISTLRSFIQTDAAINPGNSGGALVTTDARLIGINTAIYSKSGGSVGIGFAVPSLLARAVLESAREGTPIQRPWVGLKLNPVTMKIATKLGLGRPSGALVESIYPKSPGAKAGLKVGDIITAINGEEIEDEADFAFEIAVLELGSEAKLSLVRHGKTMEIPVLMEVPYTDTSIKPQQIKGYSPLKGAFMKTLEPGIALSLGLDPHLKGVIIVDLPLTASAKKLRFQEGDVVTKINDKPTKTLKSLESALAQRQKRWTIVLRRKDRIITIQVHEKKRQT